jgi:probable rRNA maturation factor
VNEIEIASSGIDEPSWLQRCRRFAAKVLKARGINRWELSVLITDDPTIQELNRRYRGADSATDVLSFSQSAAEELNARSTYRPAGDIVISLDTMARNAGERKISEEEELKRLLIHGILHLEGMDHPDEQSEMITIQENILARLKKEKVF